MWVPPRTYLTLHEPWDPWPGRRVAAVLELEHGGSTASWPAPCRCCKRHLERNGNDVTKQGWLWWFTSKSLRCLKNIHCFRRKYEVSIICETYCFTIILVSHPNSIPNKFSVLPNLSFLLWAKQIHNAFVWQSGDKQLSSSASSSANWRPHCSRCWGIQIGVLQSFKMP